MSPNDFHEMVDIYDSDPEKISVHITIAAQLISEGFELKDNQRMFVLDILKTILDTGKYQIPKKRGGQRRYTDMRDECVCFHALRLIDQGEQPTHAIEIAAGDFCVSYESAKASFYKLRHDVQVRVKEDPFYKEVLQAFVDKRLNE